MCHLFETIPKPSPKRNEQRECPICCRAVLIGGGKDKVIPDFHLKQGTNHASKQHYRQRAKSFFGLEQFVALFAIICIKGFVNFRGGFFSYNVNKILFRFINPIT